MEAKNRGFIDRITNRDLIAELQQENKQLQEALDVLTKQRSEIDIQIEEQGKLIEKLQGSVFALGRRIMQFQRFMVDEGSEEEEPSSE